MSTLVNYILILAAAALTVYLMKRKVNLGLIMLIDSGAIVLLTRMPAAEALNSAFRGLVSEKTVALILILFLIMMLENIMRNTGMIRSIVDSLKELVGSNRLAAGLLPAVIGLLPSPGGARFSCPMVEEVAAGNSEPMNLAYVNYWFRHVWLDGFILYPGLILAAELLDVSVIALFLYLVPLMLASVLIGMVFGLRGIKREEAHRTRPLTVSLKAFITALLPVIAVIAIYVCLLNFTGYSLEIAAFVVVVTLAVCKKIKGNRLLHTMKEAFPLKLVFIILGVMVFKEILLDSGVMNGLPELMKAQGVPAGVFFILLPFLGGFTSGITVSYVSITFPILIPLGLGDNLWFAAIAFTAGSIGGMVTPLHLCAVMSADYFNCALPGLLRKVAASCAVLLAGICIFLYLIAR